MDGRHHRGNNLHNQLVRFLKTLFYHRRDAYEITSYIRRTTEGRFVPTANGTYTKWEKISGFMLLNTVGILCVHGPSLYIRQNKTDIGMFTFLCSNTVFILHILNELSSILYKLNILTKKNNKYLISILLPQFKVYKNIVSIVSWVFIVQVFAAFFNFKYKCNL